ncbi:putative pentatricopeptide repeat-containing protein At3g49142 [Coffea eugenioides]|uniref:putative pentatricopeptide repeat-containing protein At3g49142 n=1 Tax=Coffea eugenioides TaxID=49369 RepID=UPI000F61330F|nr:putative pentatricopeptide repeat-containing protein At3g49142 [Coffea eugenioides]
MHALIHKIHWNSPSCFLPVFNCLSKALLLPTATVPSEAASYSQVLDKWPDIRTLKKIHCRIILHLNLNSCISFGIKLMRAYAARGQTSITRQIFDRIPERNVVIFNVMIRSYVNNHLYHDAFFMFKSMNSSNTNPDYYTFPCILKACSASMDLWVGLQVHTQVLKMNLDGNLYVGNGLIAMYGKCGDEMPRRDVVSWNSMVVG